MSDKVTDIYIRPEFVAKELEPVENVDIERELSGWERFSNINAVRKLSILLALIFLWQGYTWYSQVEPLLFPSFTASVEALWETVLTGEMFEKVWVTVYVLVMGYLAGLALAALFLIFAVSTRIGGGLPEHDDGNVPAAAGYFAAAARHALVRPRHTQPDLRDDPLGPLGRIAQHPCGFHERQ